MRIYGHYPIIVGNKTIFYRHPIREFSFTELDGKEKWAAYKFTKNVYDIRMPALIIRDRKSGRYNAVHPENYPARYNTSDLAFT